MANWQFEKSDGNPRMTLWRNAVRSRVPYPCMKSLELRERSFDYGLSLGVAAAVNILTENVAQFKKPADWWQAFKDRWFPRWAKVVWPVKYDHIDVKALYPYATYKDQEIIWKARKAA